MLTTICQQCSEPFQAESKKRKFCSLSCSCKFNGELQKRKGKTCKNCNADFAPQSLNQQFCNKSCSASHNNKVTKLKAQKVQRARPCPQCGGRKHRGSKGLCRLCTIASRQQIPIGEHKPDQNSRIRFRLVRNQARAMAQDFFPVWHCWVCGYDKHVEVAHDVPVVNFPGGATALIINAKTNLILLCPNHHWEYDHNLMSHEDRDHLEHARAIALGEYQQCLKS